VRDPRVEEFARILVEDCVDVQPGWQVLVLAQPLARPLVEAVSRKIGQRGAYALVRLRFESFSDSNLLKEAPDELFRELPSISAQELDTADCYIAIVAPENTREGSDAPQERVGLWQAATRPHVMPFLAQEKPWTGCYYPTIASSQDAGMTLAEFEDFLYGAILIDWQALRREMEKIAERFDAADEVRIVGEGTDLRFSLKGRHGEVSAADANMPSGEVFYSPIEDSAEGVISYSEYPACYLSHQVENVRFRFEAGRIVEASATADEEFLLGTLDTDEGARRLGEFGIGCNPGIQRHVRNTLFDEKIEGTVHLAIGTSFPHLGGKNVSAVHWDMVKDLRQSGRIELDGELVQEKGKWLF
jgi:aminopeptidase